MSVCERQVRLRWEGRHGAVRQTRVYVETCVLCRICQIQALDAGLWPSRRVLRWLFRNGLGCEELVGAKRVYVVRRVVREEVLGEGEQ